MKGDIIGRLRETALFRNLSERDIGAIAATARFGLKRFAKGETVLDQDQEYGSLYIIVRGICSGEMLDFSGKTIKVEDLVAPFPIASGVLFSPHNSLPVSIRAKTDVEIITLPKNDVLRLCRTNRIFLENFLTDISEKVTFLTQRLSFMSFKSIRGKVAHYILSRAGSKDSFMLPNTVEELAVYFGVARPSLSRVFRRMEEDRLIRKSGREISILDREKLMELEE